LKVENTYKTIGGVTETVNLLKTVVQNGSFSTDKLSRKLFKETMKWRACSNHECHTQMKQMSSFGQGGDYLVAEFKLCI
jgi:uridine phosphorylase